LDSVNPAAYAGVVSESDEMMTIWPGFWRFSNVILEAILVSVFVVIAVAFFVDDEPGEGVVALLIPVGLYVLNWVLTRFRPLPIRLEVTESMVRARQGKWRGAPDMEAPRSEIRSIHYLPTLISFRGVDKDNPLMMIQPQYTLRQMRKVAAELHVRLYDHTRWLGLRKIDIGRLAYDPASGPVTKVR
jgi:hypothetical protein